MIKFYISIIFLFTIENFLSKLNLSYFLWDMISMVFFLYFEKRVLNILFSLSASSAFENSSKIIKSGFLYNNLASANLCNCPPENPSPS